MMRRLFKFHWKGYKGVFFFLTDFSNFYFFFYFFFPILFYVSFRWLMDGFTRNSKATWCFIVFWKYPNNISGIASHFRLPYPTPLWFRTIYCWDILSFSERVTQRTNGRSGARERNNQCRASEWVRGASIWASGSVLTSRFLVVLNQSAPFPVIPIDHVGQCFFSAPEGLDTWPLVDKLVSQIFF